MKKEEIIEFLEKIGAEVISQDDFFIKFRYEHHDVLLSNFYELDEKKIIELIVREVKHIATMQERFTIQKGVKELLGIKL